MTSSMPQFFPNQNFPQQTFPNQGGFPNQGFPNQGFPNQGFPGQGFPNQGQQFPNQGYNRFLLYLPLFNTINSLVYFGYEIFISELQLFLSVHQLCGY